MGYSAGTHRYQSISCTFCVRSYPLIPTRGTACTVPRKTSDTRVARNIKYGPLLSPGPINRTRNRSPQRQAPFPSSRSRSRSSPEEQANCHSIYTTALHSSRDRITAGELMAYKASIVQSSNSNRQTAGLFYQYLPGFPVYCGSYSDWHSVLSRRT